MRTLWFSGGSRARSAVPLDDLAGPEIDVLDHAAAGRDALAPDPYVDLVQLRLVLQDRGLGGGNLVAARRQQRRLDLPLRLGHARLVAVEREFGLVALGHGGGAFGQQVAWRS